MVPMLIVAWREMISGDSGFSVVRSRVLGSGCSLVRVSYTAQSLMSSTRTEARGARRAAVVRGPSSLPTLASSPQSPPAQTRSRHRGGRGRTRTPCWATGCGVWRLGEWLRWRVRLSECWSGVSRSCCGGDWRQATFDFKSHTK
jgi:hypothetical protein